MALMIVRAWESNSNPPPPWGAWMWFAGWHVFLVESGNKVAKRKGGKWISVSPAYKGSEGNKEIIIAVQK